MLPFFPMLVCTIDVKRERITQMDVFVVKIVFGGGSVHCARKNQYFCTWKEDILQYNEEKFPVGVGWWSIYTDWHKASPLFVHTSHDFFLCECLITLKVPQNHFSQFLFQKHHTHNEPQSNFHLYNRHTPLWTTENKKFCLLLPPKTNTRLI